MIVRFEKPNTKTFDAFGLNSQTFLAIKGNTTKFIYIHRNPYEVLYSAAHMADTAYWYCYLNTPTDEQITEINNIKLTLQNDEDELDLTAKYYTLMDAETLKVLMSNRGK